MFQTSISQNYDLYTKADHQTWAELCRRNEILETSNISKEYIEGYQKLKLDKNSVVNIEKISDELKSLSGWCLTPVTGLIPTKDFFFMLINKIYPINIHIRKESEIEFSEQPDIFHDVCGHLPLLTNTKFTSFLTSFSTIALRYVNNERALDLLGRLYWYTYEMGVINEDGKYKPYGGAIITSSEETANVANTSVPKYIFDIDLIFRTPYNPFKLQSEYFVINSFDELFNSLENLEVKLIEYLLLPDFNCTIRNYQLNKQIGKTFNNVIGFLNDIQYKFPNSISFVAGQPDENFFEVENHLAKFDTYVNHITKQTGSCKIKTINKIAQYNKTKGIINDIIAQYLQNDENIHVTGNEVLVTVGAQEAFSIIVSTICNKNKDVIITEDPSYIGVSSFAQVFDYNIEGVRIDNEGLDLKALKNKIIDINASEKKVKLIYVIPDYQNPSGSCMPVGNRLKLLELAQQYNFLILEDGVYNSFTYSQKKNPTLKSLDKFNRVIYVGSFSKSLFPGLRIGFIVANQKVEDDYGRETALVDEMVKIKAQLTNNTSTINQAILGGVLLDLNCSLSEWSKPKLESYKVKRDHMIKCLNTYVKSYEDDWARGIYWNEPEGGFFIKMILPFEIDNNSVIESASEFNVIFCPMRYFYLNSGGENEIRLTFSNLSLDEILLGIKRLALFLQNVSVKSKKDKMPNLT